MRGRVVTPCVRRSGKPRSQYISRRQVFLARKLINTMSLSSNIVFDTSKVYTERDTRTRRVFIIGVRLLRSRDERRTKERGRTMLREREDQRLQELGDFLRTRRARLAPEDVGLSRGSRRR